MTTRLNHETLKMGLGTWKMGEISRLYEQEFNTIQSAYQQGVRLFDTAEMYGDGVAEKLLGDALASYPRSSYWLVSKIYPHHCHSKQQIYQSVHASLKRLKTDYLDTYLLHWYEDNLSLPLVVSVFEQLRQEGLIRHWGVSNFDVREMEALMKIKDASHCWTNQVLYNISERGIEYDLIPWHQQHNIPLMAYSPLAHHDRYRGFMQNKVLTDIAQRHQITIYQLMLAFVLRIPDMSLVFKSSNPVHLSDNLQAKNITLSQEDLQAINTIFPKPTKKTPLAIL